MIVALVVAAVALVAPVVGVWADSRWSGNALVVAVSALVLVAAIVAAVSGASLLLVLALGSVLLSPLLAGVFAAALIWAGVTGWRQQGRRPPYLRQVAAGVALVLVCAASTVVVFTDRRSTAIVTVCALLALLCGWAGLLLAAFVAYLAIYPVVARRDRADYVLVHGSGLVEGQLPNLLTARLDTAITRWQHLRATDAGVPLVLSGGQGRGQPRSEAAAMAQYAVEHGVPREALLLEDRSRTTEENLSFTKALVAHELGPNARGLAVTSRYHVVRTASLARRVGIDVHLAPAPAPRYVWPAAMLREFSALLGQRPIEHGVLAAAVCVPLALVVGAVLG